jgi:DNA-binding CsgD family transcriptional regulator
VDPGPALRPSRSRIRLSPREREIARLVAEGLPTKAIALRLGISAWTVSTYLRRTFARLGVQSRAAMVARLFQDGLL